jgi:uncharacterized protein (DUF885 family)
MEFVEDASKTLHSLLEEDWQWVLADNPEYASQAGQHQHDGDLQDLSPSAFERRIEHNTRMIEKVSLLAESSNDKDKLVSDLFIKNLQDEISAYSNGITRVLL